MSKRPPRGLMPRYIANELRIHKIIEAMDRFIEADYPLPIEWIEEYNELVTSTKKRTLSTGSLSVTMVAK